MISVYQGEDADVRNNQFIGEFLLEGLSEVDAGNEILVRFALDLNGILKVTAEEHATGLAEAVDGRECRVAVPAAEPAGRRGAGIAAAAWKRFLRPQRVAAERRGGRRGGHSRRRGGGHRQQQRPDLQGPGRGGQGERGGRQEIDRLVKDLRIEALGEVQGMLTDYKFVPVIRRNTPLPATRWEMFSTAHDRQEQAMISVYQGENADVRENQFIGEFLLEGLSQVDAGNEILVRFALDLNGILKVTAEEQATGLQKQLTVENAVSRFRRQSRPAGAGAASLKPAAEVAAPATSDSAAGGRAPGAGGDSGAGGAVDVPADLAAAIDRSSALISKALSVAANASDEDRQEIDRLVKDLEEASAVRSVPRLKQVGAELEDLVFYLQDA